MNTKLHLTHQQFNTCLIRHVEIQKPNIYNELKRDEKCESLLYEH